MEEKKQIYARLTGREDGPFPADAFAPGRPCGRLYDEVYRLREALGERLGTGFDDDDLAALADTYEELTRRVAFLMFDHGRFCERVKQKKE